MRLSLRQIKERKERYPAIYGAQIFKDGDEVNVGDKILEWDPFAMPILGEVEGKIVFEDIVVGSTVREEVDAVTGLSHKVVMEAKGREDASKQPRIVIVDNDDNPIIVPGTKRQAIYRIPVHAHITVNQGDEIDAGTAIAKVQRESTKTKDITGGLPRVAELFEASKPANAAQIADIAGTVEYGPEVRGSRRIIIRPEDGSEPSTIAVPKGRYVIVNEGDYVRVGDAIMDGPTNPHEILRVLGEKEVGKYIVDEIQEVYRLQGVKIDDKHIEVIVSQMLKKVEIANSGDSMFVEGDSVTKSTLVEENEKLVADGIEPAEVQIILLGITKASLSTDSFLSAASFQETTKVLTQATLEGKKDYSTWPKREHFDGKVDSCGNRHVSL